MANRPREQLGFFEEFILEEAGVVSKCLGTRTVASNDDGRVLGFYGRRNMTLTAPLPLKRGPKDVVVKASAKKPVKVWTMLQRLEGREL